VWARPAGGDGVTEAAASRAAAKVVHTSCCTIMEPDADDEVTGKWEAAMASVLVLYCCSLVENTKHHLGATGSTTLYWLD
jgi:hypothetical protein